MREVFERALSDGEALLRACLENPEFLDSLEQAALNIASCLQGGQKVMVCGNGGSLADAAHFAEEFTGRFREDRVALPVMALTDPMHMSCVANDFGFEFVFSRMVQAFGEPRDTLVLLSTSGNSPNLLRAAEAAKRAEMQTIGFLGRGGGALAPLCDIVVLAPGETSDRIQEVHMLCLHALIEAVEKKLGLA